MSTNQSEAYYFAFDTNSDGSNLTCHGIRFETVTVDKQVHAERKFNMLGSNYDEDKRVRDMFSIAHGFVEKQKAKTADEPLPADRIKALQDCLKQMCYMLDSIPIHQWDKVLSEDALLETTTKLIENRKKCVGLATETADTFRAALTMLTEAKKDILDFEKHSVYFSKVDEFVKVCERMAVLEKSGFLNRIKPLLQ